MKKLGLGLSEPHSASASPVSFTLRFVGEFNRVATVVTVGKAPDLFIMKPFYPSNDFKLNKKLSTLEKRWKQYCFDVCQPNLPRKKN
jgi:hypothetical protein